MSKIDRVKELLGINKTTDKEDMKDRHKEIIEEIKGERDN